MATLLTTRRMSPDLAARVEASVTGRRVVPGAKLRPRAISVLRFASLCLVLLALGGVVLVRQRYVANLEQQRTALLERLRREAGSLAAGDLKTVERARSWLMTASAAFGGEVIAEEMRDPQAFAAVLARPALYIRGSVRGMRTDDGLRESAAASTPDAFVHCLNAPPASRSEKAVLAKVRTVYSGSERHREATSHVHRLQVALVGLPLLHPAWQARVVKAETEPALERLRLELERTPLDAARRALKARLLIYLLDEPPDAAGPAELDGERPHPVRVGLVDLATDKVLLRSRKRVDPSWMSESIRAEYATGMDSCLVALDVREALGSAVASGR